MNDLPVLSFAITDGKLQKEKAEKCFTWRFLYHLFGRNTLFRDLYCLTMGMKLKRIYEGYSPSDGYRILVERLWPRGISKEDAHIDMWMKDVAPSSELRKWFNHEDAKWEEFQERYKKELSGSRHFQDLRKIVSIHENVTLIFSSKSENHNNAVVLYNMLE